MRLKLEKSFVPFYIIWLTLTGAFLFSLFRGDWLIAFISFSTFFLTITPFLLQNRYRFYMPLGFTASIAFFIYAAIFLGEVHNFYEKFWWWDSILHAGSAIGFGLIGVVILLLLYKGEKIKAHPKVLTLFVFSFALAIGAMWEIFEFSMDEIFGFNMQKNGLHDTMWDLIVTAIGGAIASFGGYLYITKGWKKGLLTELITEWVERNK